MVRQCVKTSGQIRRQYSQRRKVNVYCWTDLKSMKYLLLIFSIGCTNTKQFFTKYLYNHIGHYRNYDFNRRLNSQYEVQ